MTMTYYQGLFTSLLPKHITWWAKWYKASYPHLFSRTRTYIILTGLHQSTPYVPARVLHQFTLHQDLFNFTTAYENVHKLDYKTPLQTWSQLVELWECSHNFSTWHLPLVSSRTPEVSLPYKLWIYNLTSAPLVTPATNHLNKKIWLDVPSTS